MEKSTVKLYKTHKSRSFPKTTMDVYRFIVFVGCWRRSVHISGQRAMTPGRAGPFQPGGRLAHSPGPKSPVRCQLLIHTLPCIYIYRNIHTCVIYTYNCICICMYYTHIYIYIMYVYIYPWTRRAAWSLLGHIFVLSTTHLRGGFPQRSPHCRPRPLAEAWPAPAGSLEMGVS